MYSELTKQLAEGATVVTPNRRLAAALRRAFDLRARAQGQTTWPAAEVLPWKAWLERAFRDCLLRGSAHRLLMTAPQARALWQRIIAEAPEGRGLLQVTTTAEAALGAWELVHAWRLLPALQSIPLAEETLAFLRWARAYDRVCAQSQFTDQARLADAVGDLARAGALSLPGHVVLFGFDHLNPQQDELLEALRSQGVRVDIHEPARAQSPAVVLCHPGVTEEIRAAAHWARSRLAVEPQARIGVVVPELTRLRATIERIFDDVLLPEQLLRADRPAVRPWNVSLGLPLSRWPPVHAALLLLELASGSLTIHRIGVLLRSPFLGGGESERIARALLDARLRRLGDPHVTLDQLIYHAGVEGHAYTCGVLTERLTSLRYRVRDLPPRAQPASFWGPAIQSMLSAVQWPGERELNSEEYQTVSKWKELLASLAQLDLVSAPLTFESAVHHLRRLAGEDLFQPKTAEVPIQVLGPLESAQLEFDHLLVLGLTDEAWPRVARPNPLLPVELQRARGLPGASAERELVFARRLQSGWRQAAPLVIFSYHRAEGESVLAPSALLTGLPGTTLAELGVEEVADWRMAVFAAAVQDELADWSGQALPEGVRFRGGVRLIQDQAACPFRAFAAHRLGAVSLEHPQEGLDAADRGTLVHVALATLWSELSTLQRLAETGPVELASAIDRSVDHALRRLRPRRISAFQERFLALERGRLAALLHEWLNIERSRAPFAVIACEEGRVVNVGGLELKLKLDRVDRLIGGGELLIDYKTGNSSVGRWEGERPDEPQLPLYSLARTRAPQAVAFARVRRGECGFAGLAAEGGVADGIMRIPQDDWSVQLSTWRATLERLAIAFRSGAAPVDPKKRAVTCRNCDLNILCRVNELVDRGSPTAPAEAADE